MDLNLNVIELKKVENNFTNKQLAEKMKVSSKWLGVVLQRGYGTPDFINKLAKALDVEIKEIVKMEN